MTKLIMRKNAIHSYTKKVNITPVFTHHIQYKMLKRKVSFQFSRQLITHPPYFLSMGTWIENIC